MVLTAIALTVLLRQTSPAQASASPIKRFVSKLGVSLNSPVDLGRPTQVAPSLKKPTLEEYAPKGWPGCYVRLTRTSIGNDSSDDSTAAKLEDFVYKDLDLDVDLVNSVHFAAVDGWPAVEIRVKRSDGIWLQWKVIRSQSVYFGLLVKGRTLPDDLSLSKLLGSFHLPSSIVRGKVKAWGPTPHEGTLGTTRLSVWTPVQLEDSDDIPDLSDDGATGVGFSGEFGYSSYTVAVLTLPLELEERMEDEAIDQLIRLKYGEDDDGMKVTFGDFKSRTEGTNHFRTVTYVDDSLDGRVDILVSDGKLYLFAVTVPRGMLASDDVKHFYRSIAIR